MKKVAILISNLNSYEAIQLCIESVRKYTMHPYQMIVYDSGSYNKCDLEYLRKTRRDGWIELIESQENKTHGDALNFLLNERCKDDFDYAAVLDDDIFIKEEGWLEDMLGEVEKEGVLAAADYGSDLVYSHMDYYKIWFSIFNLEAYRDDMQVDWNRTSGDSREEPYKSMIERKRSLAKNPSLPIEPMAIVNDTGSKLLLKILCENPKEYRVVPCPENVKGKYEHWGKMSHDLWSTMKMGAMKEWLEKSVEINKALRGIRA